MRDITWRKKKLPSGDDVEVTTWSGAGFVLLPSMAGLQRFVRPEHRVPLGGWLAYPVTALAAAVSEAIRAEYADADEARTAKLQTASKDVAKLVEITAPKSKAAKAPRTGFLFPLPQPDPRRVAEKQATRSKATAARQQATADAKQSAAGRR